MIGLLVVLLIGIYCSLIVWILFDVEVECVLVLGDVVFG